MGDRVYVEITVNEKDVDTVLRIFEYTKETSTITTLDNGKVEVMMDDVNYGGYDFINALGSLIDFVGLHGQGGGFGSYAFSSVGTDKVTFVETGFDEGFVVNIDCETFQLDNNDVANIRTYIKQYKEFMR